MSTCPDEILALASSPGLVRQAHRMVARETFVAAGDTVTIGGVTVERLAQGPAAARCPCPATGVCLHIVAALIWLRENGSGFAGKDADVAGKGGVPVARPGRGTPTTVSLSRAMDELLASDPLELCRAAGAAVTRRAAATPVRSCSVQPDGDRVLIRPVGRATAIVYLAGLGLAGMVSDAPAGTRSVDHLCAVRDLFAAEGRPWTWPSDTGPATGLTREQHQTLALVRSAVATLLSSGLAHLPSDAADPLATVGLRARAAGLILLSRRIGETAAVIGAVAAHRDDVSERAAVIALAQDWALTEALERAGPEQLPKLLGTVRRTFRAVGSLDLVPLGALWWQTPQGARGVTAVVWQREAGEITTVTAARAAGGSDPAFRRGRSTALLWGATVPDLCAGPFRLDAPRATTEEELSPTTTGGIQPLGPFDEAELTRMAVRNWPETVTAAGLFQHSLTGPASRRPYLLAPSATGDLVIDEITQELCWPLEDADGMLLITRIPVGPVTEERAAALARLVESRADVQFVLVHTRRSEGRTVYEPSSVFTRGRQGLRLTALDFAAPAAVDLSRLEALRARFRRSAGRSADQFHEPAPDPATALCAAVLDVIEEMAATGSHVLTDRRRQLLTDRRRQAGDQAMSTVERVIGSLLDAPGAVPVSLLMRAVFVLDRCQALAG